MTTERVPTPEPVDMDDQELRRTHREWWAELSRCEDELELCPADHPARADVERAHALALEIASRLSAEVTRRRQLYDAVAAVFEESHR